MTEMLNKLYEEGNKTINSVIQLMTETHDFYDYPVKFSCTFHCGILSKYVLQNKRRRIQKVEESIVRTFCIHHTIQGFLKTAAVKRSR